MPSAIRYTTKGVKPALRSQRIIRTIAISAVTKAMTAATRASNCRVASPV